MPVATKPILVAQPILNCVQPFLSTMINLGLIQARHKRFNRNILLRASVCKNNVNAPVDSGRSRLISRSTAFSGTSCVIHRKTCWKTADFLGEIPTGFLQIGNEKDQTVI